jgi:hypothetical protein
MQISHTAYLLTGFGYGINKIKLKTMDKLQKTTEMLTDAIERLEKLNIPVVVGKSEQLRFLIDKFQTPKGNYLIDLLMEHKESK